MTPLVLAIDQGTTSTKVAAVDGAGRVVARASRETAVRRGDGTVEARPGDWWAAVAGLIGELGDRIPLADVRSVAICGFMHTLVPIGRAGPLDELAIPLPGDRRPGVNESGFGSVGSAGGRAALARFAAWAADRDLTTAVTVKDYLRAKLTDAIATDRYDGAGCGLLVAETGEPEPAAAALLRGLGAEPPPVLGPAEVAGTVSAAVARLTGLPAGTPVAVGTGDWAATCLGVRAVLPERGCLYLGTSAAYGGFPDEESLREAAPPRCLAVAVGSGALLGWAGRLLVGPQADEGAAVAALLDAAERGRPGARGARFIPGFAVATGPRERGLGRGELRGLSLDVGRDDAARAVVDGVAMGIRRCLEPHLAGELVVCGGGTRDLRWVQVLADVLARPLTVSGEPDAAIAGLAVLAWKAVGAAADWPAPAPATVTVEPRPELAAEYAALCAEFAAE
ncbi:FGGY-family carbohydrate kinase [Nonomuraea sp. M3C6]|uniref:FGGY-family carbohydrate kinase n=1 Tax=Nonomuraea marmarensis TaxID=3351344 RepID=A0ABW7AL11_9ACTN